MSRDTLLPLAVVVGVALALGGTYAWLEARHRADEEAAHETRVREREADAAHAIDEQRVESRELLAPALPGVTLGMDVDAVTGARPAGAVVQSTSRVDPGFLLYEETLPSGGQVMYAFDETTHLLARVQVLSQLPSIDAVAPHLTAMHDQFGAPTGIWDCRDAAGISTRRFTWRRSHVGLADIMLVYAERVSLTLYVTTNEQMAASLRRANCSPMQGDRLDRFPASSPDDVQRAAREEESRP